MTLSIISDVHVKQPSDEAYRLLINFLDHSLVQKSDEIIPIEVKASENLQAKSLKSFSQKYSPPRSIRTSMSNYRDEGWMENIPLYAIDSIDFK